MGKSFRDYYNESPKSKINKRNAFARPSKLHKDKSRYNRRIKGNLEDLSDFN